MRGRHRLCCCVVAATRFKPPLGTCCRRLRATDRSLHLSSKAVGAQRISRSGHLALSSPPTTLEHLRIDRADLLGFSNGGTSAAPTLVVGSDRDVMRPEGAVELFRLLPHAQLAILPRTEHMEITTRTSWLVPMINEFLDAEMPKSM